MRPLSCSSRPIDASRRDSSSLSDSDDARPGETEAASERVRLAACWSCGGLSPPGTLIDSDCLLAARFRLHRTEKSWYDYELSLVLMLWPSPSCLTRTHFLVRILDPCSQRYDSFPSSPIALLSFANPESGCFSVVCVPEWFPLGSPSG